MEEEPQVLETQTINKTLKNGLRDLKKQEGVLTKDIEDSKKVKTEYSEKLVGERNS